MSLQQGRPSKRLHNTWQAFPPILLIGGLIGLPGCGGPTSDSASSASSSAASIAQIQQDILNDMTQPIEAKIYNLPIDNITHLPLRPAWSLGGWLGMGTAPRGDASPDTWQPTLPPPAPLNPPNPPIPNVVAKSSQPWTSIAPWFVLFAGENHRATNVRVKIYDITLHILEKSTNTWKRVETAAATPVNLFPNGNPTWGSNFLHDLSNSAPQAVRDADRQIESDGTASYKLRSPTATDLGFYPIHGEGDKFDFTIPPYNIDPSNIAAVITSVKPS